MSDSHTSPVRKKIMTVADLRAALDGFPGDAEVWCFSLCYLERGFPDTLRAHVEGVRVVDGRLVLDADGRTDEQIEEDDLSFTEDEVDGADLPLTDLPLTEDEVDDE